MSFLGKLAQTLIDKYPDFTKVKIISPNKRTGLFLKDKLKKKIAARYHLVT